MSTNKISDATLRSYLLGTADEENTISIDEGCFTDEAFAERVDAIERDLIDEYVAGELDNGDHERFESYYLASPVRREKVDFAKALRSFAARPTGAPEIHAGAESPSFSASILSWRGFFPAAAAAAVLIVFAGFLGWQVFRGPDNGGEIAVNQEQTPKPNNGNAPPLPQSNERSVERPENSDRDANANVGNNSQPRNTEKNSNANKVRQSVPALATIVLSPQLRGAGLPTANIPKNAAAADFRLELEIESAGIYDVFLTDGGTGANVWSRRAIRSRLAGDRTVITMRVPAKIFKEGNYAFSVSRTQGPEIVGDYHFRVVR